MTPLPEWHTLNSSPLSDIAMALPLYGQNFFRVYPIQSGHNILLELKCMYSRNARGKLLSFHRFLSLSNVLYTLCQYRICGLMFMLHYTIILRHYYTINVCIVK